MKYQKITKVLKNSQRNNSENNKQIPRETYISPEGRFFFFVVDNPGSIIIV